MKVQIWACAEWRAERQTDNEEAKFERSEIASVCEFNLAFQVMSASKEANTDSHLNFYRNVHSMQEVSPNHRTSNAPI